MVADALSRNDDLLNSLLADKESRYEKHSNIYTMITVVPTSYWELNKSNELDPKLNNMVAERLFNMNSWLKFTLSNKVLRYKTMTFIGNNKMLRNRLVNIAHESNIRGHVGVQNSYQRLNVCFIYQPRKS